MESRAHLRLWHVGQTHTDYPADWLNIILAEAARRCLIKAIEATAPLSRQQWCGDKEVERPSIRILSRYAKRYTCSTVWQPFWAYR
ncbi:MAG: hypothetical protein F4W68_01280 [Cenarchaeum sp. SB0661_bin_35]|nr:hypothetical protein [Cenarchaeum sp. SB0667_bin_13]MXZ93895.1 hypothetical protein [Cenarchaeum sp. SB0666_bin_15]MYC79124.1 hypothetical protein [Cenarchaeum sp. SB0661_bin_35]MYD59158.1 hypothetical protein [Cenarchaeum sp. SB0678_bin_8]MYG33833.1 hypothetical protein [Cenarchaeum sp. SB0677_bin_16]MYI51820.1 hypothetical protein [Cenarchaeum sp. SB0673_bin_9]MYJ27776.1 hypothetical protein [Cenarchaeum sp. SB0672_bin_9]